MIQPYPVKAHWWILIVDDTFAGLQFITISYRIPLVNKKKFYQEKRKMISQRT